ncbi:MAG: hypothetical protein D6732_19270 [Methanobacteriota archaeon]|nr:MAG: hypothetical protein D6732_19270 [Euryarchaeota archaeon]
MSARRGATRRKKKVMSSIEKWRNKIWVEIKTPLYIDDKVIGETPSSSEESIIGRTVKIDLMTLTANFKDMNKLITFKIVDLKGNVAHTEFFRYELSRDFIRSQVRNHRSRIDGIYNLTLKDKSKLRITLTCVTPIRVKTSEQKVIRKIMQETLMELVGDLTFQSFVTNLLQNKFAEQIQEKVEEYFPVKVFEVNKVKVLKFPEAD